MNTSPTPPPVRRPDIGTLPPARSTARRRLASGLMAPLGLGLIATFALAPLPRAAAAPATDITTVAVPVTPQRSTIDRADRQSTDKDQVVAALPSTDTGGFSTIGVTWSAASTGAVPDFEIRLKRDGAWSSWESLETNAGGVEVAEDGRQSTDPVYVGESRGIELRALGDSSTTVSDVALTMIDSPEVSSDTNPAALAPDAPDATAASDLAPRPAIVSRAGWGADESVRCSDAEMRDKINTTVRGVVVHHTAGSNSYSASQSASIIRGIYSYHVKTLGWCDIGYNFLVDKYGKIFEGRWGGVTRPVHGSHATSWNTDTMGVSFMGNYDTATPPAVMLDAGAAVIAWKLDGYFRDPKGRVTLAGKNVNVIFRHGDVMQTACPGRYVTSQMGALRDNVARRMGATSAMRAYWASRSWLGEPTDMEAVLGGGRKGTFQHGDLYQSPNGRIHSIQNSLRSRYNQQGGPTGTLGWPTSSEVDGLTANSRQNSFERGRIIWTARNGAWAIANGIHNNYLGLSPAERDSVGVPVSNEGPGQVAGVSTQRFSSGQYYWSARTGTAPLWGGIRNRYQAIGAETSPIGLPTGKEGNAKVSGARQVTFSQGAIVWSPGNGAWELEGAIHHLTRDMSPAAATSLGAPTGAEYRGITAGSVKQNFAGGRVYWSSATKAHSVSGDIGTEYRRLGEDGSRLGLPVTEEYAVSGGRAVDFAGGRISWQSATRQVTVTYR